VVALDGGAVVGAFEASPTLSDVGCEAGAVRWVWGTGVGCLIYGAGVVDIGFGGGVGALDGGMVAVSPSSEFMRAPPDCSLGVPECWGICVPGGETNQPTKGSVSEAPDNIGSFIAPSSTTGPTTPLRQFSSEGRSMECSRRLMPESARWCPVELGRLSTR